MHEERGPGFQSHTPQERSPQFFVYFFSWRWTFSPGYVPGTKDPNLQSRIASPGWETGSRASSQPGLDLISPLVKEDTLKGYYDECQKLLKEFLHISFQHILRAQNQEANHLAQSASGYRVFREVLSSEALNDDWRIKIADYLRNNHRKLPKS